MSIPTIRPQDLVEAGLFGSENEVSQEAFRHLLLDRPDLRLSVALHRYRTDEELSLAQAASIAGVSFERMKEILAQRQIPLRLGSASLEEAKTEVETLETWLRADSD